MKPISHPSSTSTLGISFEGEKVHFALFSSSAEEVFLGIFTKNREKPFQEFSLEREGDIWRIALENLPKNCSYAYRIKGPYAPEKGLLFRESAWLVDPYAKIVDTSPTWGKQLGHPLAKVALPPPFDWQGVERPNIPKEKLVIYEMHVRGFTQDPSSKVEHRGTFLGMIEKIPYLQKLGVTAVELLPIFEFDEIHSQDIQPHTGEPLLNYWGYNPLFFFCPMRRYAVQDPIYECKMLIRELHRAGIEVFLDVVFNHTGEGNEKEYYVHFRGIDNRVYYMVNEEGNYLDYTGCGNTINANHPVVRQWILDVLTYWIEEFQIDGFRFDLASTLTRASNGAPLDPSPILEAISQIPHVKWIAEPWDVGGLYQVGVFPKWGPWSDWNGRYRDVARRFIKGTDGYAGAFADALSGSSSLFGAYRTPLASINFITAHDGYTMRDLVTYQMKHNYDNGEMNQDGNNQNDTWNCGAEGPTTKKEVLDLRERQLRNFCVALLFSQGIPMLLMGDEYGNTRKGNNNPYVQDNDINWFQWNFLEKNENIFLFWKKLLSFRQNYPLFQKTTFFSPQDITWHGTTGDPPNWESSSRFVACTLHGSPPLYLAFHPGPGSLLVQLPPGKWRLLLDTAKDWDAPMLGEEETLLDTPSYEMAPYSSICLSFHS